MLAESYVTVLALAISFSLASASPIDIPKATTLNSDPAVPWTVSRCAEVPKGIALNDTSIAWMDCQEFDAMQEKKKRACIDCDHGTCNVQTFDSMELQGHGTWWTKPCHAAGLHTRNVGSSAYVTTLSTTSITYSAEFGLGGSVGKFLDAKLGFEVTKSKSVGQTAGCVNVDGQAHAVWFQEQMGWSDTKITTVQRSTGSGCNPDIPREVTTVRVVHADFPDPHNSGFRDLSAGCYSPDNEEGPWCNWQASNLQWS